MNSKVGPPILATQMIFQTNPSVIETFELRVLYMGNILAIKVTTPKLNLCAIATSKAYFLHIKNPFMFHLLCADVASKDARKAYYPQ